MTQTPGEPVTRPTPTSVAAAAPFEEVHPAAEPPTGSRGAVAGSRRSVAGLAALAVGAALAAALVVRRRVAAAPRWRRRS